MIDFALQASGEDAEDAVKAEGLGFVAYYVADHPGSGLSPLGPLAAAANATSSIHLGAYVTNVGVREPFHIAADVATLDVISNGRAILGLWAGHTPAEWRAIGEERPSPGERIDRLIEITSVVGKLLDGQTIDFEGEHVTLQRATLNDPRPLQDRIPLLIGGGNRRLLDLAGREADIVGLMGAGRTRADGHSHEVRWAVEAVDEQVHRVNEAAKDRESGPALEALVQAVRITNDRVAAAEAFETIPTKHALTAPYLLLGTLDVIAEQLIANRKRWGITRYAVRTDAIDAIAPLIGQV